jgi:SAM-dependent methyltransferase
MAPTAEYDEIADWSEEEFLGGHATGAGKSGGNPIDLGGLLRDLLGDGGGACLEIGCGTGVHAAQVGQLGRTPLGIDLSAGMLRHARGRLPVARADAEHLPIRGDTLPAVIAVMVHTDMPAYPAILREVARVLRPGGVFVHIGVHPCFGGGFADRADPGAVVIRPGYTDGHWTRASWTDRGVRAKVGATHWPLPELMHAFLGAGLALERFAESNEPAPVVLAVRTRKPSQPALPVTGPRPGGDRKDRVGHDVGPVTGDVMARAVDDDVTSLRRGRGQPRLQGRPVRAEPAREAAGGAQDDDGHIGKRRRGGAQLPQGRHGRGDVIAQLVGESGPPGPQAQLEWHGQSALHLLVPRVHQDQARAQVRPAEGQQLDQDPAPAVPGQHARPGRQPGNHRCQLIDLAVDEHRPRRGGAAAEPRPVVGGHAHVRGQ